MSGHSILLNPCLENLLAQQRVLAQNFYSYTKNDENGPESQRNFVTHSNFINIGSFQKIHLEFLNYEIFKAKLRTCLTNEHQVKNCLIISEKCQIICPRFVFRKFDHRPTLESILKLKFNKMGKNGILVGNLVTLHV